MKLSIIIPVYNEEKSISEVVNDLLQVDLGKVEKEIIIVNDGSTDNTEAVINSLKQKNAELTLLNMSRNSGKGAAVAKGIEVASGEYILIQDADKEYNPNQIPFLLEPILEQREDVVYGTRLKRLPNFSKDERTPLMLMHYLGNKLLSLITSVLYGQWITDMETGYKLFPKESLKGVTLKAKGFELEPELTARLLKSGYRIFEVPITTNPRTHAEGKKLHAIKDGRIALWTLLKYRIIN